LTRDGYHTGELNTEEKTIKIVMKNIQQEMRTIKKPILEDIAYKFCHLKMP
jgi:hypothetical protein